LRNRLLAQAHQNRQGRGGMDAKNRKKVKKYEAVFKFEEESVKLINLKACCKLFKSTMVPS
jgi:hypothetical protein